MKKNPLYRVMISAIALATTCLATSSCTPRTQSATVRSKHFSRKE